MNFRIRTRLMLTYFMLIFISMSILGFSLLVSLKSFYINHLANELAKEANLVSDLVRPLLLQDDSDKIQLLSKEMGKKINTRITIIRNDGLVLGDSNYDPSKMDNHANRPEVKKALRGSEGISTRYSTTLDIDTMYVAKPLVYNGKILSVVRLSLPLTEINKTIFKLKISILVGILIASSVAVLLSIKLAKTITEPIEEINNTANKISQGDLEQKIFVHSQDEVGQLGYAINEMTSALKKQILEVTAGKKRLEAILNHMVSGVLVISDKGKIQELNLEAEKILGARKNEVLGKSYQSIVRNFGFQETIDNVMKSGEVTSYEFSLIYPENRTLKAYIAPISQDEKVSQIVIVFHDITSIRQLEKMKSDFVANASHELRTPVAAIKGFAETLLDGAIKEEELCKKFVTIINNEADRLIRLISDLLDLSALEAKGTELIKEPNDISQILKEVILNLTKEANEKDVEISLNIKNDLPKIEVNKDMIIQAFINLLDNAIKYSKDKGKVEVSARVEEDKMVIKFKDDGIGIPKEDLPRIFERFYRVDKARSKEIGGTGLGLSIVKHILELHKGKIKVESEQGKGTTFWLLLPLN